MITEAVDTSGRASNELRLSHGSSENMFQKMPAQSFSFVLDDECELKRDDTSR